MKVETRTLLEKARQSLDAASSLERDGFYGFAASRIYYAMFYIAEALLFERGMAFNSHSAVISAFGKHFAKTGLLSVRFHRHLLDAQDTRNISDYGIESSIGIEQVIEMKKWAEDFLAAAEKLLSV